MSMYPWRAGEVITAEKLTAGMQYGLVSITPGAVIDGTTYRRGSAVVTFDVPFVDVPTIQVTARTSTPGVLIEASYTDVTPTSVTIMIARETTFSTNVDWLAIGRPAL